MQKVEDFFNTLLMVIVFIVSVLCLGVGVLRINEATSGVGLICAAIFFLVLLRIMQAASSQAKIMQELKLLNKENRE